MSIETWQNEVETAINKYLCESPKSNDDVIALSSLLILQEKLPTMSYNLESSDPSAEDNKPNALLKNMQNDFNAYAENKEIYKNKPTPQNLNIELEDLKHILENIKELLSVLWQSSNAEEKELLKSHFKHYKEKYRI